MPRRRPQSAQYAEVIASVFVRVHRSAIVNSTRVVAAEPLFYGELTLVLRDGSRVQCSRRHRKDIEGKFYFTS